MTPSVTSRPVMSVISDSDVTTVSRASVELMVGNVELI